MMNQWSQAAFYYYCFKTFKTQNFTIKLSNHLLKVNQIKQLPVGTILSFYYFSKTVHLRFCSSINDQNDWKNKLHKATLHDSTVMVFSMWTKVEDVKVLDCKKRIRREDLGFNGKIIINKVMHFMLFLLLADWLARTTQCLVISW